MEWCSLLLLTSVGSHLLCLCIFCCFACHLNLAALLYPSALGCYISTSPPPVVPLLVFNWLFIFSSRLSLHRYNSGWLIRLQGQRWLWLACSLMTVFLLPQVKAELSLSRARAAALEADLGALNDSQAAQQQQLEILQERLRASEAHAAVADQQLKERADIPQVLYCIAHNGSS